MVAHEAADDAELLGVFFAEDGDVGLDDLEEFGDDGADAVEVAGAGGSAEGLGEGGFGDADAGVGGVHFGGGGVEDDVYAFGDAAGAVGGEGAGVGGVVFVGAELGGVDEDGDDDDVGVFFGEADEGEVAFVEVAHGGDEADAFAGRAPGLGGGVHVGAVVRRWSWVGGGAWSGGGCWSAGLL